MAIAVKASGTELTHDFSAWIGRAAILDVRIGLSMLPFYGRVIGATGKEVRIRIANCLDLDVPKHWIVDIHPDILFDLRTQSSASKQAGDLPSQR